MQKVRGLIVALGGLLAAALPSQGAVLNGDFETGSFDAGWSGANGTPNTGFAGGAVTVTGTEGKIGNYAAVLGYASATGSGAILQDVPTVPGTAYTLTFAFGQFGPANNTYNMQVQLDVYDVTHLFDPSPAYTQTIGPLVYSDNSGNGYVNDASVFDGLINGTYNVSVPFVATGTLTRLQFVNVTGDEAAADLVLDNIALTTVPEPASLGLMSLPALLMMRRRTRN